MHVRYASPQKLLFRKFWYIFQMGCDAFEWSYTWMVFSHTATWAIECTSVQCGCIIERSLLTTEIYWPTIHYNFKHQGTSIIFITSLHSVLREFIIMLDLTRTCTQSRPKNVKIKIIYSFLRNLVYSSRILINLRQKLKGEIGKTMVWTWDFEWRYCY